MTPLLAAGFFGLGGMEILILVILGVLLFGRKLPEVGRSLGKGIVEFKKGLKGLEDEVEGSTAAASKVEAPVEVPRPPQRIATAAPKFDEPTDSEGKPRYS
jgi:sec-independent protein translocase protein TatA